MRAGACTGLRSAGETRRGPRAEQGVFAACQPHIAVILRVHPGAQHGGNGYTVRAGTLAVVTGVAARGRSMHLRVPPEDRPAVACRSPPTRRAQVLIDVLWARHGE